MKTGPVKSADGDFRESGILSAYLAEYEAKCAELLQVQGAQGQLVLYSLLFVGVSIPIVATLLQSEAWISLLVLPLLFSSMAWAYVGYVGMAYRIGIYINSHLRPAINNLLQPETPNSIFAWGKFAHTRGLNIFAVPRGFEILLFILPSIGSMILFFYIKHSLGSGLTSADWILFAFGALLTMGALIMALVIMKLGYSKLLED